MAVQAANRLMRKIEQNILNLGQNPYSCKEVCIKPRNEMYRKLVIENYIVLYRIEKELKKVVIYRIVYGKKDYLNI